MVRMRKTIAAVVFCIGALELRAATYDVLVTVEDRRVERWQVTDGAWTKGGDFGDWKSLKLAPVAVAASPAKKVYVACAGTSNTLEEFEPGGAHLRTVATLRFRPYALALSPDGKWACLTARSRTIYRISLATGEVKPLVQNASIYTTGLAFGPGGLLYLGSAYDGLISVYDVTKTLADDTAAKRLGAIRAFDCQSGFAFGGKDLGRLIVPGTWYESVDLDRGESDVGYSEKPSLGNCRATVRVGGEVYAADCGSGRTLVRIPATAGTVEKVADMTGPVSSMANLTETFDGSEPARFAAAKARSFASEPKLAGGMTDFERMNYNNPGLEVDLEGGIWPMPMICADDALEIRTRSVPRVCTLHFAKKAPYRYSAGAEVRSGASRSKYPRTAGCAAPGAPSGAMRRTGDWKDYYADLNGDGTVDCLRLYSDWTKYGAAGPACKIVYDEKGYWTTGQVQFDAYVYLREGGIAGGRWAAPRKVLPDDFNAAKEGPWGEGGAVFADFDGDGDVDFVTGDFRSELWYVENVGTRTEPTFAKPRRARDTDGEPLEGDLCMMTVLADDYDGDGKTDVVAGEEDGRVSVFRNTGKLTADRTPVFEPQRFLRQEADVLTFGCLVTPYAVDWDGDGDLDFICGNSAGYIAFVENLSGPGVERPKWAVPKRMTVKDPKKCRVEMWLKGDIIQSRGGDSSSPQGPAEAKWGYTVCTVADWDGDGFLDVMANDIKGSVVWFRNPGQKGATCLEAPQAVEVEWEGAQPRFAWEWRQPPKGKALRAPWRTTPLMHDWDGDGLVDLIMLDTDGHLALYRRAKENGRLVLKPPRPLVHDLSGKPMKFQGARGGSGRRKFCLCDWDGDGRLDFLINGSNVYALLNRGEKDGKPVFEETRKLARKTLSGHSNCPTVVDFNADGIPDIVSGAEDGNFYYFRNPRTAARADKVRMLAVAHRGIHFAAGLPENSLQAFKAAYDAGAKWIETDFHYLKNGRILCVHDRKALKAMSGVDCDIATLTEEDVASIDIGKARKTAEPVRMPYLEDVLACIPKDAFAQCEIKTYHKNYPDKFDAAVKAAGLTERNILVSSGSYAALADFHKRKPGYRTLWLNAGLKADGKPWNVENAIRLAKDAGVDILCPGCALAMKAGVSPSDAGRVRAAGLDFRLFGVRSPEMLAYAASLKATAFTTDLWRKSFEWAKAVPSAELVPSL